MTILEQVCASGGTDVIHDTLQLSCPVWPEPIYLVRGFFDTVFTLEDGTRQVFTAAPMRVVLPKKSNEANQTLSFAIDNVTGEAQRLLDQALEAEAPVTLTFRRYLDSDRNAPAEPAFVATVLGGNMISATVQVQAGFMNLLDYKYPRDLYDLNFAPALAYL